MSNRLPRLLGRATLWVVLGLAPVALERPAGAQMAVLDPAAQTVMSSRDFEKLLGAIGFEANQRATAGAMFDDLQRELMAARDELADAPPAGPSADSRALADHEARARRAHQRMAAAEHTFFEGLAAIAQPAQQAAVTRERLGAACRLARRTLGPREGANGAVRVDLVAAVAEARIPEEARARAFEALAGYQAQLADALRQALDTGLSVPAKAARLREAEAGGARAGDSGEAVVPFLVGGDAAARQASKAFDAAVDRLTQLHLVGIAALDGPLDDAAADAIAVDAARRIWPMASRDPRSPRAAFAQFAREIETGARPAEQRAALEAARQSWLAAWWSATHKACDAETSLRRLGLFMPPSDESRALRRAMREATDQRDEADRAAWRALAALDPERAEFYRPLIAPPDRSEPFPMMGGPEPVPPSTAPAVARGAGSEGGAGGAGGASEAPVVQTFSSAVMIVASAPAGGDDAEDAIAMPLVFEGSSEGPISIQMGPDGVATLMSDTLGDGLGEGEPFVLEASDDAMSTRLSGAALPAPMRRDAALEHARVLTGSATPPAVFDQLYADYAERCRQIDDALGAAARERLRGVPAGMRIRTSKSGAPDEVEELQQRTIEDLRGGVAKLDEYVAALAEADDAFIANLAAIAPAATAVERLREERARERLDALRYPTTAMFHSPFARPGAGADLAPVVRAARLQGADAQAAERILAEWSPAAVAAREQARGVRRDSALELLEAERGMLKRMEELRAAAGDGGGSAIRRTLSSEDAEAMRGPGAVMERLTAAMTRVWEFDAATQARLEEALSAEGAAAFQDAWCRATAPRAYVDARNADAALQRALALPDLTPEERRQIEALRATHVAEHAALTGKIGRIAARQALDSPSAGLVTGGPARDAGAAARAREARKLSTLRFDRAELNERTIRRLRTILGQDHAHAVLGGTAGAPRTTTP
jgi:hypothetical protein